MVDRGQVEAVYVLLERGADVTARDPDGRSLFEVARDRAFDEIAGLLERYKR
ncbi:MAG: hypothetical protein WBN92_17800 [Terriglobia bacterium]